MLRDGAPADDSSSGEADAPVPISIRRNRFPHAVVWGPLGPLTCCCPCVGHMGIGDSLGRIHDFAGSNYVGVDDFMVGTVWRYAVVSSSSNPRWDAAIEKADAVYWKKSHNIVCENCHHHTALALDAAGQPQWGCGGLVSTWILCFWHGKCTWC